MIERVVEETVPSIVAKTLALIPTPVPGRDGRDGAQGPQGERGLDGLNGRDGHDGKDGADGRHGRDGAPGKDGVDGFGLDDISVEVKGDRTLVMRLSNEQRTVTRTVTLGGLPVYRGIYKSGAEHDHGDMVTYGGSLWMALRDTKEAPKGPADDWKLVVKGGK